MKKALQDYLTRIGYEMPNDLFINEIIKSEINQQDFNMTDNQFQQCKWIIRNYQLLKDVYENEFENWFYEN